MRRISRCLWPWGVSLAALMLILGVLVVGAFRVLVAALPAYHHELVQRVEAVVGQPVTVGRFDLGWSGWYPTLVLDRVRVFATPGGSAIATIARVRLNFDLTRIIHNDWTPIRLLLLAPSLTLRRDAHGHLHIAGFKQAAKTGESEDWRTRLRHLSALKAVIIREGRISMTDAGHPVLNGRYRHIDAHFGVDGTRVFGAANADLPAQLAAHAHASFQLTHLQKAARTRIAVHSMVTGLLPQPWLTGYLRPGVRLYGRIDELRLDADYGNGRWEHAHARLEAGPLSASAGDRHGSLMSIFTHFYATADWRAGQAGWSLQLNSIDPGLPGAAAGSAAPDLRASVTYHRADGDKPGTYDLNLPNLPLGAVAPWLGLIRSPLPNWVADTAPTGEIRHLVIDGQPSGGAFSIDGIMDGVSTRPTGEVPGVVGVSGRFHDDRQGGNMTLHMLGGLLRAPQALDHPLPVSRLDARLHWQRTSNGWFARADGVSIRALDASARGSTDLTLSPGKPPQVSLQARFSADSATQLKGLIPRVWPDELRQWLKSSIAGGRVDNGHLKIEGALPDFPFVGKPGNFDINFDAHNGELDYADDWPVISDINAHLDFHGLSMRIDADHATILGVPIATAQASIADLRHAVLRVHGRANADLASQLQFLAQSPLRKRNHELLQNLHAKGPSALDLSLSLPLDNIDAGQYSGDIALRGDQIDYDAWPHKITAVKGKLHFSGDGLKARNISAHSDGLDFSVDLDPLSGAGATRLTATTRLAFPQDRAAVADYVPDVLLNRLSGSSVWQLQVDFSGATAGSLALSSNLNGTALALPAPVGKPPAQVVPIRVRIKQPGGGAMQVDVSATNTLNALIRLHRREQNWQFDRGDIRLGGSAALPAGAGLSIDGRLAKANAADWLRFARSLGKDGARSQAGQGADSILRQINLDIGELTGYGQHWRNVGLRISPTHQGWMGTATSPDVDGLVKVQNPGSGARMHIVADMGRLKVDTSSLDLKASTSGNSDSAPIDPGTLPTLDFECVHCTVDNINLGNVVADVKPLANGLRLSKLLMNGNDLDASAGGRWTRNSGKSQATLHFKVDTARIADLIKAMGFSPSVSAKQSHAQAELQWMPSANGLDLKNLKGTLALKLEKGSLVAVDPGAGRVLGLINFYALPRRLMLNFRDVVDKGLAFDRVQGQFHLEGGSAYTENDGLRLTGPSLRMVMKGRIGLAAEDYDEVVTIYPGLGSTLPIAGAVLGGPAVGAFMLLAQKLLDKPLEALTSFSYHLGGTWSNPSVSKSK